MSLSLLQAKVRSTHPDTSQVSVWDPLEAAVEVLGERLGSAGAGVQSSAVPTNTAGTPFTILTTDSTVFTLAAGERGFIQNHDDVVLNVKLGALASTSSFTHRLKACATADDGSGGYIQISNWIGVVSVAAATGSPRFTAWKI